MPRPSYTLITGASSGIGRELAVQAARDGRNVVLVSQQVQLLNELAAHLAEKYGVATLALPVDVAQPGATQRLYTEVKSRRLLIDALINDAGLGAYGLFVSDDPQRLREMLHVNVMALTELTHLLLPDLLKRPHANIMNVASVAGFLPGPYMAVYFATKHYVLAFSEGLRQELHGTGVRVTALCPPPTQTPFVQTARIPRKNYMATTKVSPAQVAAYGWRAMKRSKPVAVYGLQYKFLTAFLVRITPRWGLRWLLFKLNTQGL